MRTQWDEVMIKSGVINTVYDGIPASSAVDPPIEIDSVFVYLFYPFYVGEDGDNVCLFVDQTQPFVGSNSCINIANFVHWNGSSPECCPK